jgi:hypothetical protein
MKKSRLCGETFQHSTVVNYKNSRQHPENGKTEQHERRDSLTFPCLKFIAYQLIFFHFSVGLHQKPATDKQSFENPTKNNYAKNPNGNSNQKSCSVHIWKRC